VPRDTLSADAYKCATKIIGHGARVETGAELTAEGVERKMTIANAGTFGDFFPFALNVLFNRFGETRYQLRKVATAVWRPSK
jgi:hypothetical protein